MFVSMYPFICIATCVCMYACMLVGIRAYAWRYVRMHVCMSVYIHIWIYIYIYIHIYTYVQGGLYKHARGMMPSRGHRTGLTGLKPDALINSVSITP